MKNTNGIKDKAVLFAWIIGLLLLLSILWFFTQPVQSSYLMKSANNVLNNNNHIRNEQQLRLSQSISIKSDKSSLFGYWYSIYNSTEIMFIFPVFRDGVLVPLGAIISDEGKVDEILPLSAHAVHIFNALPDSVLQMYTARIESAAISVIAQGDK